MTPVLPVTALRDGDKVVCRPDGVEVLVCRVDGRFYALSNRCPHAGQSLHGGRLRGFELRCPLHAAAFDVRDGRCLRPPADSGLVSYPVLIEAGKVHVALDRPRPPLDAAAR